jgi:hypothetical protein
MANVYGLQTLTFGVPTVTGYVVQSLTKTNNCANVVEVHDENGDRAVVRYSDETNEISFDAYIAGATLPSAGGVITIDGVTYEVISVEVKAENKGARKVAIKGKKSEKITPAGA